jgi:hypothetical protein
VLYVLELPIGAFYDNNIYFIHRDKFSQNSGHTNNDENLKQCLKYFFLYRVKIYAFMLIFISVTNGKKDHI